MKKALLPEVQIAERLAYARRVYALRTGEDVSWAELGRRWWKRLNRKGEVDTSKLSRIKKGQQLLTIPECGAFADELGAPKGWLAFEDGRAPRMEKGTLASPARRQIVEERAPGTAQDDRKRGEG